jgi:polysaccharide biosynthesis transport protein
LLQRATDPAAVDFSSRLERALLAPSVGNPPWMRRMNSTASLTPREFVAICLVAVRCWWKATIPAATILAITAAIAVYALHKPKYTADAWLLIKSKPDVILREVDSGSQRFIQNQLEILRSPRLLAPLASDSEIASTPELRKERDLVAALAHQVRIYSRGESDIYIVSFTSESPEKAALIVGEVVNAYVTFNRKIDSEHQHRILQLLQDQQQARYQEMAELREKVRRISVELTGVDPFRANLSPDEKSKQSTTMAALQADLIRYEVAQHVIAANLQAEEDRTKEVVELTSEDRQAIERDIERLPPFLAYVERIDQLRRKEADFLRTSKNPETQPLYRQVRTEIASEIAARDAWLTEQRQQLTGVALKERRAAREEKLEALRAEYAAGEARLKVLNQRFEEDMGKARRFTDDNLGLEFHKAKLEQVTKIHDEISSRILALTTEQRAPERVMVFKEAAVPLHPDQAIPIKNMALASVLAFLFPVWLTVLWEHVFRRVISRSQVEEKHLIPVVGEITALNGPMPNAARLEAPWRRDVLVFRESVESLRTYLSLAESLRDKSVFAVTSAVSGEGKTSLAVQLAISIENATGEPVLLIDGDMRSPDVHNHFGLTSDRGLADVLEGRVELSDAIRWQEGSQLAVLPAGRLTRSPHRLLKQEMRSILFDEVRKRFRYVIIDTPPILPASESLLLAQGADAAVLCMRRDFSRVDQVKEAHDRLMASGVRLAGGVLNGIPLGQYRNKYGAYPYGDESFGSNEPPDSHEPRALEATARPS